MLSGVRACLPRPPPSAANTPPHRQQGSRRDGGSGSWRLARRQAQARQQQLALLDVPQEAGVRYDDRSNGAQPRDDLSGVVESTHMGVAGGEKAIRLRVAWILLDREEEFRYCLIEAPSEEMRGAYYRHRRAVAGAGTEPQRGLDMLDRDFGLARPRRFWNCAVRRSGRRLD